MPPKKKQKINVNENQRKMSDFWSKGTEIPDKIIDSESNLSIETDTGMAPECNISESSAPAETIMITDSSCKSGGQNESNAKSASTTTEIHTAPISGNGRDNNNNIQSAKALELIKEHFGAALDEGKLHSFYTCSGKCFDLPKDELQRINAKQPVSASKKRMFRHEWLMDDKTAYSQETGVWWLIYIEGQGMFCLLCRVHNATNKFNKQNIFNMSASTNYKHSAVKDHQKAIGHTSTFLCELERRNSSLALMNKQAQETRDTVTFNAFLASYWLGKEEVSNRKFLSLIDLQKQVGVEEMNHFKNTSERSQKDMRLLIGQLIKEKLIQQIKDVKWFSILVDEVTDCSTTEQLLIYIGYVDAHGESHFDFLECKDVLEDSHSPDSATITSIILQEMKACGLDTRYMCGFGSDGASVMTGRVNGVGVRLQAVATSMLRTHCISHRLALACGDANDEVKYITTVETTLRQLWKWLEYPKRCSAFVKVCKSMNSIKLTNETMKQKKLRKKLALKIQKACRTRWLSTGQSIASVSKNLVAIFMTLRQFKDHDATAHGLLTRMNNNKFVGTLMLLNKILPHLNCLSKLFQKDHTCYSSIKPALQSTKASIENIQTSVDIVTELENATKPGGVYEDLELHMSAEDPVRKFLKSFLQNYTSSLARNIDRRFEEASPVLQAFSVFDPTTLPAKTEPDFEEHGKDQIEILTNQFHFDHKETLTQWQNFKYQMLDWKLPEAILRGDKQEISPTHYVLKRLVKEQAAYKIGFSNLVQLAQICMTQPLSNAVVERGASAVKRVKTRLRSNLKNNMLASLLHISINGPANRTDECCNLLSEASQIWRKTHIRNLPPLKKLPSVGGSNHSDSQYNTAQTIDCAVQANLIDMPPLQQGRDEIQEQLLQEELNDNVNVQHVQACGDQEYQDALQALDLFDQTHDSHDSGLDSDSDYSDF